MNTRRFERRADNSACSSLKLERCMSSSTTTSPSRMPFLKGMTEAVSVIGQ